MLESVIRDFVTASEAASEGSALADSRALARLGQCVHDRLKSDERR